MLKKPIVYFLCTGNSCRSQIAEGFLKSLGGSRFDVYSAGLEAHGLNPRAIHVMSEVGIDISRQSSDVISNDLLTKADFVITLCGHADEHCPAISNPLGIRWHWGFEDPAKATGSEDEILLRFREVRDAIKSKIVQFLDEDDSKL